MSRYNNAAIQEASSRWLAGVFDGVPSIALTLTFKQRIGWDRLTADVAQQTLRHFLRRLNRVSRGKKFRKRRPALTVLAVREGGCGKAHKHLHYHLQLEVPSDRSPAEFGAHCLRTWSSLDWGSDRYNRMSVSADEGWTEYLLKLRDKPNFADAVDVMNCYWEKH